MTAASRRSYPPELLVHPAPDNSTMATRRKAREEAEAVEGKRPRRSLALKAGVDAETDFEITHTTGGDSVRKIRD